MNISVVIISYNEAENISRCIESVVHISDDIIVVDSFSTDNTIKLAEQAGARVFSQTWKGYGQAKNIGAQHAKNNWILSLDADEICSEQLALSINKLSKATEKAYMINRQNIFCGYWIKYGHWASDKSIRLYHKRYALWSQNKVHEYIITTQKTGTINGFIIHYTVKSISQYIDQSKKYAELSAQEIKTKNVLVLMFKLWTSPFILFVKSYFIKKGFLDKKAGIIIATVSAYSTWQKYAKALRYRFISYF